MTYYEQMIISAVRYALGRLTYIVGLTVDYVLKDIEDKKLSQKCLYIIKQDKSCGVRICIKTICPS